MPATYGAVTVTSSATLIIAENVSRKELTITNNDGTSPLYLGTDSSVTASTGSPLYPYQTTDRSRGMGTWLGPIYGITSSASVDVRYLQVTIA